MNEFQKALEALQATDLSFPAPKRKTTPAPPKPKHDKRLRKASVQPGAPTEMPTSAPTPPLVSNDPPAEPADPAIAPPEEEGPRRRRPHVEREWPPVGTQLTGEYQGTIYHAEVVAAKKRLKSGRQIRLLDGPAKGKRLDSFSKAMLVATAKQRKAGKLGKKGIASGWTAPTGNRGTIPTSPRSRPTSSPNASTPPSTT